jgi:hypothetical protein
MMFPMTAMGHFETNRLTRRHVRFTSKCGRARSDTSVAAPCQKGSLRTGRSQGETAGKSQTRCYRPMRRGVMTSELKK